MAILSIRAYARHRGVSHTAVQRALSSGRISQLPNGMIDSDVADSEWKENTIVRPPILRNRQTEDDGESFGGAQYTKARAVREHYQARLAKIEYEEKVGSLVSKDDVKIAQFNIDRQRRDAMLNIADRVCTSIAAEVKDLLAAAGVSEETSRAMDMARVHEILTIEIRKGLNDYSDSLIN
jgi:hypothetical protein